MQKHMTKKKLNRGIIIGNMIRKKELIFLSENEMWKTIPDYEYYQASSFGRVKSLPRMVDSKGGSKRLADGKILNKILDSYGYPVSVLRSNGKPRHFKVHQLVAMAFYGYMPDGNKTHVRHLDNNKENNNILNLKIGTPRENALDKEIFGTSKYRGVHWCKNKKRWISQIGFNNKRFHIGEFKTEVRASIAYNFAELQLNQLEKINQ